MSQITFIEDYSITIQEGEDYSALLAAKKWALKCKITEPKSLLYTHEDDWGKILNAKAIRSVINLYYKRRSPTVFCIGAFHEHQLWFLEAIAPYVKDHSYVTLKIDGDCWTYEFRGGKVNEIPC